MIMGMKFIGILLFICVVAQFGPSVTGMNFLLNGVGAFTDSIFKSFFPFFSNCTSGVGEIHLIFYSPYDYAIEANLDTLDTLSVDSSFVTVFLIHGFLSQGTGTWQNNTVSALLETQPYNIFVVDWRNGACTETVKIASLPSYGSAANNTKAVGDYVASCIESLCDIHSVSPENVWLIGHSLGAHVAGFAGKRVYANRAEKVGRITGLDPAGPLFTGLNSSSRLDKTDAIFVEITHTSGLVGLQEAIGHIDIYFNGGLYQGNCLADAPGCSHSRALDYYIEAIVNPDCHFRGKSWSRLKGYQNVSGDCSVSCTICGPLAPTLSARGTFYVETNGQAPYCTGELPTTGVIVEIPMTQIGIDPLDDKIFKYIF